MTLDPRPPALRGERRYLVKQRKLAVYRRVCAVQLFNEDLDHLDAPLCFCVLSRALSPPCIRHAGKIIFPPASLLYHGTREASGATHAMMGGFAVEI